MEQNVHDLFSREFVGGCEFFQFFADGIFDECFEFGQVENDDLFTKRVENRLYPTKIAGLEILAQLFFIFLAETNSELLRENQRSLACEHED